MIEKERRNTDMWLLFAFGSALFAGLLLIVAGTLALLI